MGDVPASYKGKLYDFLTELFLEIADLLDVTTLLFGNLIEDSSVWNNIFLNQDKDNIGYHY